MLKSRHTSHRWLAYCGIAFPIVFFPGMLLAGLFPPDSPTDSAAEIAAQWRDDADLKRLGLFLCMWAGGLTAGMGAVVSVYLKKIDPDGGYSNLQMLGAACGVIAILVPVFLFAVVAFRPEDRSDELILAFSDAAWIPFVMNTPPALMQTFAIGFAALSDDREEPIFPRWFGYYQLWTAFLFLPGGFVILFKEGPFAWNGLLAFWVVAVLFGLWFIVTSVMTLKAIRRDQERGAGTPVQSP